MDRQRSLSQVVGYLKGPGIISAVERPRPSGPSRSRDSQPKPLVSCGSSHAKETSPVKNTAKLKPEISALRPLISSQAAVTLETPIFVWLEERSARTAGKATRWHPHVVAPFWTVERRLRSGVQLGRSSKQRTWFGAIKPGVSRIRNQIDRRKFEVSLHFRRSACMRKACYKQGNFKALACPFNRWQG